MVSVETTFDCLCYSNYMVNYIIDCFIRETCTDLTVLMEYFDISRLPEASEDGLDPSLRNVMFDKCIMCFHGRMHPDVCL